MDDKDFLNFCGINKNDLINIENKKFKKANEVYKYKKLNWFLYKNFSYQPGCKEIKTNGKWKYVQIYSIMNYNNNNYRNCKKYIYFYDYNNYCRINIGGYNFITENKINGLSYNKYISKKDNNEIYIYRLTPYYFINLIYNHNYLLKYKKKKNLSKNKNNILKINNYCLFIFG